MKDYIFNIISLIQLIFFFMPFFIKILISANKRYNYINLKLKIFIFIKIIEVKISLNNKLIVLSGIVNKKINLSDIKFKKPKISWIFKAIIFNKIYITYNYNLLEFCKNPSSFTQKAAMIELIEILTLKFKKKRKKINTTLFNSIITSEIIISTSIYLILKEFLNQIIIKLKGGVNAKPKLFTKHN